MVFVDSNCDGIDGDDAKAVFVALTGDDGASGLTREAPKRTVSAALVAAQAAGRTDVYAAAGTYDEGVGVDLPSGIGIYGGYATGGWSRSPLYTTVIQGSPQAATASGATGVTLQLLTLHGTAGDGSAYGLRAVAGSQLSLSAVTVESGAGSTGANGSGYIAPAVSGTAGDPGVDGYEDDAYFYCAGDQADPPPFTSAGTNSADSSANGGRGRRGGITNGGNVAGGAGEPSPGGAAGGLPHSGSAGGDGDDGTGGENGSVGQPGGLVYSAGGAVPTAGEDGGAGTRGQGGGGGAGGGSSHSTGTCNDWGGSGGGGGGGGAGGAGGRGATSGGGSFAVFLWASSATFTDSALTTADGGDGGVGSLGQAGGDGALGGLGGGGYDEGAAGGDGGNGGDGGDGGRGGGGAGGPAVGVLSGAGSDVTTSNVVFTLGSGGQGGAPNGPDGLSANTYVP
jgi:hypothetical protein